MPSVQKWAAGLLLFVLIGVLAACNGNQATEAPLPDAQSLLTKAALEVQNAKTIRIKLQLTGAPSYVDPPAGPGLPGNTIAFISANGVFVAPDRVSATVNAKIGVLASSVDVIAIGDDQWMSNRILTAGQWVKRIFSPGFNAGNLVSGTGGIREALNAMQSIKVVGRETINGTPMIHLTGTASGPELSSLTVGLIRGNQVLVDIYITEATGQLDHVVMVQPDTVSTAEPDPTTWTLELYDYNKPAQVDSPDGSVPTAAATVAATVAATAPATEQATSAQ